MKLGVMTVALGKLSFDEACKFLSENGVQTVEIGCGGYPGTAHAHGKTFLEDESKRRELLDSLERYNMEISGLSCHGNMVHPNPEIAASFDEDFTNAILLAEKLKVRVINTFSGCPGGCKEDKTPNWAVASWPEDFQEVLKYQWEDVLIPYWRDKVVFAREHGVDQIAIEMHPGFSVYNTSTLLRLREAVGPEIGANFDPSHLFWQGIDPVASIRALGKENAIFHFHAKDTKIDSYNNAVNGVLDVRHYSDEVNRSWIFRTVGYGTDYSVWKAIMSELRLAGYDGAISIEHEDSLMSSTEGLLKAITFLKEVLLYEKREGMFWA